MTGNAEDGPEWQKHIGNKAERRELAKRFRDSEDPFRIVIVSAAFGRCKCRMTSIACRTEPTSQIALLHSHFASLADQLKKALVTYTESGGQGNPTFDPAQAIAVMLEKHGIACDMMPGRERLEAEV